MPNNRFNRTAPFVTEFATRCARLRKLRANPLRGIGLPVKRMLDLQKKITEKCKFGVV